MSKPKISREALDRKITQIVLGVSKHQEDYANKIKHEEDLRFLQDKVEKQLESIYSNDRMQSLESTKDLVQALNNMDAEIDGALTSQVNQQTKPLSAVVGSAVDEYLESIDKFRQQGGEYFNGSVVYEPYSSDEKDALYRILESLKEEGYPVKVVEDAQRLSGEAEKGSFSTKVFSSLNFVTSIEGVDAFEWHAKAEGIPILRQDIKCKRLFLDFSGQIAKPEAREFMPEHDSHGGHVANKYERNAFVMGSGPVWQDHNDHQPKAKKFITMAMAAKPSSVENTIFYMYSKNGGFDKTTPISLAKDVEARNQEQSSEMKP